MWTPVCRGKLAEVEESGIGARRLPFSVFLGALLLLPVLAASAAAARRAKPRVCCVFFAEHTPPEGTAEEQPALQQLAARACCGGGGSSPHLEVYFMTAEAAGVGHVTCARQEALPAVPLVRGSR